MLDKLNAFYLQAQATLVKKFNRTLPFGEYVVDRWKKAELLGFGKGSSIYDSAIVFGQVEVGENTWIGPNTLLDGSAGRLVIGQGCNISAGTQIYTHDTVLRTISAGKEPIRSGNTSIGDHCYIGPNCVIALGVSIGDRVVIGANSFVNHDIPSDCRAWGTPARVIVESGNS